MELLLCSHLQPWFSKVALAQEAGRPNPVLPALPWLPLEQGACMNAIKIVQSAQIVEFLVKAFKSPMSFLICIYLIQTSN